MNIFFLDLEPKKCAEYHVDSHVVKIILEACQMMATAYPKGGAPYKHTHANHPMAVWVRSSLDNFIWTLDYCYALCSEYTAMVNGTKVKMWQIGLLIICLTLMILDLLILLVALAKLKPANPIVL